MGQHSIPESPATRLFDAVSVVHGDRRVRAFKAACSKCGFSTNVSVGSMFADDGNRELRLIVRKFEDRGWKVSNSKTHHRCPGCEAKAIEERRNGGARPTLVKVSNKVEGNVVGGQTVTKQGDLAPAPSEMTKEHRRIIFIKLNEVYVSETTGYANDWTDLKVAQDLGVPRGWVEAIRRENFGEKAGNDVIGPSLEEARKVIAQGRKMLAEIDDLKQTVELATKRINTLMGETAPLVSLVIECEGRLRQIEKTIR